MTTDDRLIGLPGDTLIDESWVFPFSEELPASAWHVPAMLKELHARGIRGQNVKVYVGDTAPRTQHPFLKKELVGRNFTTDGYPNDDINGHGNHCLGIVASVAPDVDFITGKVLGGKGGSGQSSWINSSRVWAAEQGADIFSESLGDNGGPPIASDLAAYDKVYELGGVICVAALGNAGYNGATTIGRPGSYSNHNHGIAAIQSDWKTIAGFSSGGPQARFAAPGVGIVSCRPGGGWVLMSGTSMATPWQAGFYALLLSWLRGQGYADMIGPKAWSDWFVNNKLSPVAVLNCLPLYAPIFQPYSQPPGGGHLDEKRGAARHAHRAG
jgi:subtilisin family serine protease